MVFFLFIILQISTTPQMNCPFSDSSLPILRQPTGHYEMSSSPEGAPLVNLVANVSEPNEERLVIIPGGMYAKARDILVESCVDKKARRPEGLVAMTLESLLHRYDALDFHYNRLKKENASLKRVVILCSGYLTK
eukprot:GHVP01029689.1.p1 GENE.GHVP01029689.1~~GHVP01029689.1.p1  ORF type:complete len:135 (+),score=16.88 GHVP01029689.1:318-722(+)